MRVLITGVNGQLGSDIAKEIAGKGFIAVGSDVQKDSEHCTLYTKMDITDKDAVNLNIKYLKPHVVIHCAAWTEVDKGEIASNIDKMFRINTIGTVNLANACRECGCKMLYISTDYVFDGEGDSPWTTEHDIDRQPLNVYGISKYLGEKAVINVAPKYYIVRSSWLFGKNGKNFVKSVLDATERNEPFSVVDDQIGRPTYTKDLAKLIAEIIATDKYGIYHVTNEGENVSRYEYAKEILRQAGKTADVFPIATKDCREKQANRPLNSRLDTSKIKESGFTPLPDWKDALWRYLNE